ncbi:MAG: hypothetical protein E7318_09970 [Clostridiales bacterium]|nr:hypothetical protein [Clostridiales bacterium]
MKNQDFTLRAAYPAMPDDCRAALMDAARSVKEEEPMKRKFPVAILVAAILTLMTTVAIAEGWNVLAFLGIQPDSDAQTLMQPVSANAKTGNVTLRIDSAITDGEYLAFDYAVSNTKPETPVYLVVEDFTANGETIFTDGTDDFDYQWLPGWCNDGTMMDGEWVNLPSLTGNTLHVEMIVSVYTPDKPVYLMDEFDADAIRQKWNEGYYVIAGGDGFIINDPEEGLVQGFGPVNQVTGVGLSRSEMKVGFDLDLKAARASVRTPELPAPVIKDGTTLAVQSISISPLQTHIVATFTPENANYEDIVRWSDSMNFAFYDEDGNELDHYGMCLMPMYEITVEESPDGTWFRQFDCCLIEVAQSLPDTVILVYETEDGFRIKLPVTLK